MLDRRERTRDSPPRRLPPTPWASSNFGFGMSFASAATNRYRNRPGRHHKSLHLPERSILCRPTCSTWSRCDPGASCDAGARSPPGYCQPATHPEPPLIPTPTRARCQRNDGDPRPFPWLGFLSRGFGAEFTCKVQVPGLHTCLVCPGLRCLAKGGRATDVPISDPGHGLIPPRAPCRRTRGGRRAPRPR